MSNLEKYLSVTNRMGALRVEIDLLRANIDSKDLEYDRLIDEAENLHNNLNDFEKKFATGRFRGPRIWIEVVGLPGDKRLGIAFDLDPSKGPDFDEIKKYLDSIENIEDRCMFIDARTQVMAHYYANTKTLN